MQPIFISYARSSSAAAARALSAALPGQCFLDTSDIEFGDKFPETIVHALLASRVVVVFADDTYFQRRYCLWELRAALEPYESHQWSGSHPEGLLEHLVLVLPERNRPAELDRLPPVLRRMNWPTADNVPAIAELLAKRLRKSNRTLGARCEGHSQTSEDVRRRLLGLAALPAPAMFPKEAPSYPTSLAALSLREDFVGRVDELHLIDFWLRTLRGERSNAPPVVTIEGPGGVGKTRLALEYVHRLATRHFPGGILWIDAGKPLETQFHEALQALDPTAPDLSQLRQQKRDLIKELATALRVQTARGDVLWVVDNVPEPDLNASRPLPLSTYCPALGHVATLVTSRRKLSLEPGFRDVRLHELDTQSAVQLLTRGVPPQEHFSRDSWRTIVEWVGRLPLALTLLNQVLLSGSSPRALLEMAKREKPTAALDQAMSALRREVESNSVRGVTEALSISYEKLARPTRAAARLLAQFAPIPIPMAVVDEMDGIFTLEVRRQLIGRSFVVRQEAASTSPDAFGSMHRIIADFLRTKDEDSREAWRSACNVLERVLRKSSDGDHRGTLLQACAPHALHVLRMGDPADDAYLLLAASLQVTVSWSLRELGKLRMSLEVIEGAVDVYRRLVKSKPGLYESRLAWALRRLSIVLWESGHTEVGLKAAEKAVQVWRTLAKSQLEHDLAALGGALNHLRDLSRDLGRQEESARVAAEAVGVYSRLAKAGPGTFKSQLGAARASLSACLRAMSKPRPRVAKPLIPKVSTSTQRRAGTTTKIPTWSAERKTITQSILTSGALPQVLSGLIDPVSVTLEPTPRVRSARRRGTGGS